MPFALRSFPLALAAVATLITIPSACQSGGVGDPCTPDQEQDATFTGFQMDQDYIESRSFECATRVCMVNHFQGRVSCPLGQPAADVTPCAGPGDTRCGAGRSCVVSSTLAIPCAPCDPAQDPGCVPTTCAPGLTCDPTQQICACDTKNSPTFSTSDVDYTCVPFDPSCRPTAARPCAGLLTSFVCHTPGACQTEDGTTAQNQHKDCCLPGTDTPVGVPVCGQCGSTSKRAAATSVYCSCRCDVADGDPPEPDYNFCTCPTGFTCTQLRSDLLLGDPLATGKYCVIDGTAYEPSDAAACTVAGNAESPCVGLSAP
jgi:hypothetical protein